MKLTLIMLDNPIIVSDEKLDKCYEGFYFLDGTLFHTSKVMLQTGCKEVIAQSHQINWSGLESKFGYIDVEKLAEEYLIKTKHEVSLRKEAFIRGFKKAQELNDKKFSLEDIERTFNVGVNAHYEAKELNKTDTFDFLQTKLFQFTRILSQPKSFSIEVEMEYYDPLPPLRQVATRPKFTDGKIKILKIY